MLNTENSLLLVIDLQEKLVNMIENPSKLVKNSSVLLKTAEVLNIPTIITEQYPKGLGETLPEIKKQNTNSKIFEKFSFSATLNEDILNQINSINKQQIIIFGIEAHICVLQTAICLKDYGYDVFFIDNCSASRNSSDFNTAVSFLKQKNVNIINSEIALFMLLKSSKHPNFKELQQLIK